MKIFKIFLTSIIGIFIFVYIFRLASSGNLSNRLSFIGVSDLASIFETFPDSQLFLDDLNDFLRAIENLFTLGEGNWIEPSNGFENVLLHIADSLLDIYDIVNACFRCVIDIFYMFYLVFKWFIEFLGFIVTPSFGRL